MSTTQPTPDDTVAPTESEEATPQSHEPAADVPAYLSDVLKTVSVGLAVADLDSWELTYENATFFGWFPPDPTREDTLVVRIPSFDTEKALKRFERGRSFRFDTEVGSGARMVTVDVEIQAHELHGKQRAVISCQNGTKRKEAEHMLDSYARMAEKNTREVKREKERAEKLLLNIMPRAVFEEMKDFGSVAPQRFDSATILMLDFEGFTDMAVSREPSALIAQLNDIFSAFDRIVELFGCERMKTTGDAYMAVAGIPEQAADHAENIARVALRMRRYLEKRNSSHPEPWLARIGVHTGTVVGSIVGVQKYVYDIFGPGVNMASRMETCADPMQIVMSEDTFDLIGHQFLTTDLGDVNVKGFGTQRLYSLDGETSAR